MGATMKLTKPILGCSGGEILPRIYAAGEDCPDDLIAAARELGALEERPKAPPAPKAGGKSS